MNLYPGIFDDFLRAGRIHPPDNAGMTAVETARTLYEDSLEGEGAQLSGEALTRRLREQAGKLREGNLREMSQETRQEVATALVDDEGASLEESACELEKAADDLDTAFRGTTLTVKELDDGVAGQAVLGSNEIWIDHDAMMEDGGDNLIDHSKTVDIVEHEKEHTQQSPDADADGITVDGQAFDAREIREAAAISVQKRTDFLSAEYQRIFRELPMDAQDRELVRAGRFQQLEAKKNGAETAAALAA